MFPGFPNISELYTPKERQYLVQGFTVLGALVNGYTALVYLDRVAMVAMMLLFLVALSLQFVDFREDYEKN